MANETALADQSRTTSAEPYRPSNSSEGVEFEQRFCRRCIYEGDWENGEGCALLSDAYIGKQPVQWIEDANGPRCTAFWPREGE